MSDYAIIITNITTSYRLNNLVTVKDKTSAMIYKFLRSGHNQYADPFQDPDRFGLFLKITYYIWDQKKQKIMSYKNVWVHKDETLSLTKYEWRFAAKDLSENLFKDTVLE